MSQNASLLGGHSAVMLWKIVAAGGVASSTHVLCPVASELLLALPPGSWEEMPMKMRVCRALNENLDLPRVTDAYARKWESWAQAYGRPGVKGGETARPTPVSPPKALLTPAKRHS